MFDSLLQHAGSLISGDMGEKLGSLNEFITTVQSQIADSGLDGNVQANVVESFQNIQKALSTMPPDFGAIQQNAAQLQAIVHDHADNPLIQQIQEKIQPLLNNVLTQK